MTDIRFYLQWIRANGWAEAAGLGTTFFVGTQLAPTLEHASGPFAILLTALLAVLLGTVLEGVIVGLAQGKVLHRRFAAIAVKDWVIASAIGAGLAWLIGMIPSTLMSLMEPVGSEASFEEPGPLVQYLLAAGLGLVAGPILGVAQWIVLRKHVARSISWLWANALAWAVGMPLVFVGMDLVPWDGSAMAQGVAIYAVCLLVGFIVGAIHGLFLLRLTRLVKVPDPAT